MTLNTNLHSELPQSKEIILISLNDVDNKLVVYTRAEARVVVRVQENASYCELEDVVDIVYLRRIF
jgi:hypothetical protein